MKSIIFSLIVLGVLIGVVLFINSRSKAGKITNKNLSGCRIRPNCVSSQASRSHYIKPLYYFGPHTLDHIIKFLQEHYLVRVVTRQEEYVHLVVTTPRLRFKDDLEFLAKPKEGLVEIRSTSRVGYWDIDVNRKRLERLRAYCKAKFGPQPVKNVD